MITTVKFINATFIEEKPPISTWTDWWEKSEVEDEVQVIAVINEEDPKVVDVSDLKQWKWKNEVEHSPSWTLVINPMHSERFWANFNIQ